MDVSVKIENTLYNQKLARKIRDLNDELKNNIQVSFNDDITLIILEGESIFIPNKELLPRDSIISGIIKKRDQYVEIQPKEKGKIVNLRLDSELVEELSRIRQHVSNKTQHDIILDVFRKGIEQYNNEKD